MPTSYHPRRLALCCLIPCLLFAASAQAILLFPKTALAFNLSVAPVKPSYQVNEPIRLTVAANQPYYLYVFSIDERNNDAIMILPNRTVANNRFGLHKTDVVPSRQAEFYSDHVGTEKVLVVASLKQLPLDPKNFEYIGDFLHGKSAAFEKSLGVQFRQTDPNANTLIVRQLTIPIKHRAVSQPLSGLATHTPTTFAAIPTDSDGLLQHTALALTPEQPYTLHFYPVYPSL